MVAAMFDSVPLSPNGDEANGIAKADLDRLQTAVEDLKGGKPIAWDSSNELYKAVESAIMAEKPAVGANSCTPKLSGQQAYIFHVKWWTNNLDKPIGGGQLLSSDWYAYHYKESENKLFRDRQSGAGDPIIYGEKVALIVGVDIFNTYTDSGSTTHRYGGQLSTKYQVTVTPGSPANWTNLGSLISGVLQLQTKATGATQQNYEGYIAVACQKGPKTLPFDLAIGETVDKTVDKTKADGKSSGEKTPAVPSPGNVTCNGANESTPCAMSRTFTSTDKEYWDVSLGVSIPGVRESVLTFNSSSNSISSKPTTHTEIYAFLDLYLTAARASKDSPVPHINLGVPVTSKTLYRPYFGLAENVTGWNGLQQKLQIPTGISVFGGMCWMKTQQLVGSMPTTQSGFNSEVSYHRVWKPMFGVEVSVSSLANKLGGKSKNANAKTSTSQGTGTQ